VILAFFTAWGARQTKEVAKRTSDLAQATRNLVRVQALEKRLAAHSAVYSVIRSAILRVAGQKDKETVYGLIKAGLTNIELTQNELRLITEAMMSAPYVFDTWLWSEYMEKVAVGNRATLGKEWYDWFRKLEEDCLKHKVAFEVAAK